MKLIMAMLLISNAAFADIKSAIKDYENQKFEKAYTEFELLSQLGYSTTHHYLAKMLMNGEGVDKNLIKAYAWSKFSEREGSDFNKLTVLIRDKLTRGDLKKAEEIAKHFKETYTYDYIKYNLVDSINQVSTFELIPEKSKTVAPMYPRKMAMIKQEGYVSFSFNIYPDGSVRDIYIENEFPKGGFTQEALNAISKYNIAYKVNGQDIKLEKPMVGEQLINFKLDTTNILPVSDEQNKIVSETRQLALKGNIFAGLQYYYYFTYYPKKDEQISPEQMNQWLINASDKGYTDALYILGKNMYYGLGIVKQKQLGIDRLVNAALYGSNQAQYLLSKLITRNEIKSKFNNDDFYWLNNASKNGSLNAKLEFVKYISKLENRDKKLIKRAKSYLKQYAKEMIKSPDWYQAKALLQAKNKQYSQAQTSINHAIESARKAHWDLTELKAQRKLIKKHKQIY